MKRIFIYGLILACLILGTSALGAWSLFHGSQNRTVRGQQGNLELSMTIDKNVILAGQDIDFFFNLENKGDKNITFWIGPPFFDVYLYDLNDVLEAKWTDGRDFTQYVLNITLKPGENFSKNVRWNLYSHNHETGALIPVKPGQYRISGVWLGEPVIETDKINATVKGTGAPADVTRFKAVVNEMRSVDVFVCVDINDGLTEKEAELIVGTTFIQVKGDYVTHRLDTLTFDYAKIEAHYTWGIDENDMGHIFDVTADLTTLLITVTHCR